MPGGYLYGWDATRNVWVKLVCDSNGKLKIDTALLLENPPIEDESKKAATSEWSYDHWKNAAAHHSKFTAADARAAINNIFGSDGHADNHIYLDRHVIYEIEYIIFSGRDDGLSAGLMTFDHANRNFDLLAYDNTGNYADFDLRKYDGSVYHLLATQKYVDDKYSGLVGTLYWSCPGVHFDSLHPNTDNVYKSTSGYIKADADGIRFMASVSLPPGATVTKVIIYGNEAASAANMYLRRIEISTGIISNMGYALINAEDTTISYALINNTLFGYFLSTSSLDTNDEIWGARITYTL